MFSLTSGLNETEKLMEDEATHRLDKISKGMANK